MSAKGKGDYNHLLPLGSDSEEEADERLVIDENSVPDVNIKETLTTKSLKNGNGYKFARSPTPSYKDRCCSPTRAAIVLAMSLLCLGVGYLAGFLTPVSIKQLGQESSSRSIGKRTPNWRTKLSDYGTESCVRLLDVDGDGLLDLIIGVALGKDVSHMVTEASMKAFCSNLGMKTPCAGGVIALRGYDGKLLWKTNSYSEVFALNCHAIDVNKDGYTDCIATGRLATIQAINPRNGEILWETSPKYLNLGWNIYSTAIIQDLDYDGVGEIVMAHGGDPTISAEIHERKACRLVMVSGGTGVPIGRHLDMPEFKETYISPVVHERKDGSQYILYGSGGETVGGLFLAISIPDFYRHVNNLPHDHPVPNVRGKYDQWGFKQPSSKGEIELFRSDEKGVMVPPVLVDMNKDGVKDILMSAFDGTMVLYDGETLQIMWKADFRGESYSSPAPGYFNDDDVLDFMVHWSAGAWPFYNHTDTIVIDGKTGDTLWNLTTNKYDVSSDLVARTTARNRDVFLFKVQGRNGIDLSGAGAFHGATGVQRVVNTRSIDDGVAEFQDIVVNDNNAALEGVILPESHFRAKRAAIDENYVECDSDQTVFLAELFAVDRTTMKAPVKLWERGSEKYYYKLTSHDRELIKENIKQYGAQHDLTQNEVPWSRGKRQAQKPYCILLQPDERTTGAIGDVDGDGKLDVIVNLISVGILRDEYAQFVKMKFDTDIYKINLEEAIAEGLNIPINVTLHRTMQNIMNENRMTTLKFLPTDQQTWGGYMGMLGDSMFHT